ncbi:MAG: hypothetical protein WDN72_00565 [Alphaproteobacteria bacterium]
MLVTIGVPLYAGLTVSFMLGHRHLMEIQRQQPAPVATYLLSASNPIGIISGFYQIHKEASYYKQTPVYRQYYFNAKFDLIFYGPLIAGGFLGLFTLFIMRAPLLDFRPRQQEGKDPW